MNESVDVYPDGKLHRLVNRVLHNSLLVRIYSCSVDLDHFKLSQTDNPDVVEARLYSSEADLDPDEIFFFDLSPRIQNKIFKRIPTKGMLQKVALSPPKGKLPKFVG